MTPPPEWDLEKYLPLLRQMAGNLLGFRSLHTTFSASDLVQETSVRAIKYRADCRAATEAEYVKWLHTIMVNALRDENDRRKAAKRDPDREQDLQAAINESSRRLEEILPADQSSPSEQAARMEQLAKLAKAIEQLPDDQREVVIRRDLHGESVKQIAEALRKTEKAVAGLLLRGRQRLRELLDGFE